MARFIDHLHLYTDGGSRGNPGAGAVGVVVCLPDNTVLHEYSGCVGHCTNNQAEYRALIMGLDVCALYTRGFVTCFLDSEIVVKQMNGEYRLRNRALRELFHEVNRNATVFQNVTYQHVRRTNQRIQQADVLLNNAQNGMCIDRAHA